jgi:hypothetical protein
MHGGAGPDQPRHRLRILLGRRRSKANPRRNPVGAQRTQRPPHPGRSCGSTNTSVLVVTLLPSPLWRGGTQSRTVLRNVDRPRPDQQRRSLLPVGVPHTGSTGHPRRARRDEAARRGAASACDPCVRTPRPTTRRSDARLVTRSPVRSDVAREPQATSESCRPNPTRNRRWAMVRGPCCPYGCEW